MTKPRAVRIPSSPASLFAFDQTGSTNRVYEPVTLVAEQLKRKRWQEADLKTRPKGNAVKVALAARLRSETTMTVGWIAERLRMGTRGHVNHLLYRRRKFSE